MPGAISTNFDFNLLIAAPLDDRVRVATIVERDTMGAIRRYNLMIVSVVETNKTYQLVVNDGNVMNNTNWVEWFKDVIPHSLADHTDVTIVPEDLIDGQVMTWDSVLGKFVAKQSRAGLNIVIFDYNLGLNEGVPGLGYVCKDNSSPTFTLKLSVNKVDSHGDTPSVFFTDMSSGDIIRLAKSSNPAVFEEYSVTGIAIEYADTWDIPVSWITGAGSLLNEDVITFNWKLQSKSTWGNISGSLNAQIDLKEEFDKHFLKEEYLDTSSGSASAGLPVKLNSNGKINSNLLSNTVSYIVGSFTPTTPSPYPNTIGHTFGAMWMVTFPSPSDTFLYTTGTLAGTTVKVNDYLIYTMTGWLVQAADPTSSLYYRIDGAVALTQNLAGGGKRLSNITDSEVGTDAATVARVNSHTAQVLPGDEPHGLSAANILTKLGGLNAINYWQSVNGKLYYNLTNVGIGTATASEKLEVAGNVKVTGQILSYLSASAGVQNGIVLHDSNTGSGEGIRILWSSTSYTSLGGIHATGDGTGGNLYFSTSPGTNTVTPIVGMVLTRDNRLGLGSATYPTGDARLNIKETTAGGKLLRLESTSPWYFKTVSSTLIALQAEVANTTFSVANDGGNNIIEFLGNGVNSYTLASFPLKSSSSIGSTSFIPGWDSATGWQAYFVSGVPTIETGNLIVRGTLQVYELLVQQIRATNGSVIISASGEIDSFMGTSPDEVVTLVGKGSGADVAPFSPGDIVITQTVSIGGSTLVKQLIREVLSVTGLEVTMKAAVGGPVSTGTYAKGDAVVRIGSRTDAARQGIIYLTADESTAPYIDIKAGVTSWGDWVATGIGGTVSSKLKVRLGRLDGIVDADAGLNNFFNYYGLYSSNVHLKGHIYSQSGNIGGWTLSANSISKNQIELNATTGYIKAGTLLNATTIATTNSGMFVDNAGNFLIKGNTSGADYIKVTASGTISINSTNFSLTTLGNIGLGATSFWEGNGVWISSSPYVFNPDPYIETGRFRIGNAGASRMQWNDSDLLFYNSANVQVVSIGATNRIAGWSFTPTCFSSLISNKGVYISNSESETIATGIRRGVTFIDTNSGLATGAVKTLRMGMLPDANTLSTFSTTNYGFLIQTKTGTSTVADVFRADASGAHIAAFNFNATSLWSSSVELTSTYIAVTGTSGMFKIHLTGDIYSKWKVVAGTGTYPTYMDFNNGDGTSSVDSIIRNLDGNMTVESSDSSTLKGATVYLESDTLIRLIGTQVVLDTLPTSAPATAGQLYTQTAAQLGGTGTIKVVCIK